VGNGIRLEIEEDWTAWRQETGNVWKVEKSPIYGCNGGMLDVVLKGALVLGGTSELCSRTCSRDGPSANE